jgi:hypothetical protein
MNDEINPSNTSVAIDTYDLHIVPAEIAARREREGENYKHLPDAPGLTMDKEGLMNNYAIEPEMHYEVSDDLQKSDRSKN